jgi:hypothetical protein
MLDWLEQSVLGLWVGESEWGYPFVLSAHAIGMAILAGMIIMINLRIAGFAASAPIGRFKRMLDLIYIGTFINVASGIALFCGGATRIAPVWAFWAKLLFIALGLWALFKAYNGASKEPGSSTSDQRYMAIASIFFWILALICGRLFAYLD